MESNRTRFLIACGLFLAVIAVYFPVNGFDFVNYDDPDYVARNFIVQQGLTLKGFAWAFSGGHAANYHPLTWISHMLDCQLFGVAPGAHHLVNVIIHGLTSALLFVLLFRWTNAMWRSAFVAAVFALHPMRVESVAWISERKDVLSALFFVLTLLAYTDYAKRKSAPSPNGAAKAYGLCVAAFVCGLLSKPMLVTLPFVVVLIDYWPLQRVDSIRSLANLLREKIPLFLLSAAACVVTFVAQKSADAVHYVPISDRIAKIPVAYTGYIGKLLWPASHSVLYANNLAKFSVGVVLAATVFLLLVSVAVVLQRDRRYLAVGWLWFLGMLVPVIGIIQAGELFIAERNTLLPGIGFFMALTWWVCELGPKYRKPLATVAILAIVACAILTTRQLPTWKNSGTLWQQALANEPENLTAHNNYGIYLMEEDSNKPAPDLNGAVEVFQDALRISPTDYKAWNNLGQAYLKQTNLTQAISCLETSLRYKPNYPNAMVNMGDALRKLRRYPEALTFLEPAVRLMPSDTPPHLSLAGVYDDMGRFADAIPQYEFVLNIHPASATTHCNLAIDLAALGKLSEAMPHFESALALDPENPRFHYYHAWALARSGNLSEAFEEYRATIKLDDQSLDALGDLSWLLATCADARLRNGHEAVRYAQRACELTHFSNPRYLTSLDAAYAEAGQFTEAIATAEKAQSIFTSTGATKLAQQCASRIEQYRAGKTFRLGQ